ncbi:serine carboxypeptidase S28 [Oesophagostomum dentatum]|uniref:Serine carboxypeptidase S28 n=1 Tax=Oesophagostomum dentatum TaxID=61180 RepID=A0A0B1T922_OESDE|nr:serine carboxypeptidase S28 [Oesophagostomum dentatum]
MSVSTAIILQNSVTPTMTLTLTQLIFSKTKNFWNSIKLSLAGQRQWFWQSCTEFGMFETTNGGPGNIFGMGVPLRLIMALFFYFINMCTEVFGPKYNIDFIAKAVRETNIRYGGADGYRGTNVVITNGNNDPWTRLGKTTSYEESVVCFQITGAAHCADFAGRPPGFEIPEVEDARRIIVENIEMWLQRPNNKLANLEQTWEMPRARTVYPKSKPIKAAALPSHKAYPDWSRYKRMHLGRPPMGFVRPKPPKIKQMTQKAERNFITQPMNHFNDDDMRVFQQKYYINSAYAKTGGPIFLVIGGETPMSSAWVEGQDMFHMVLAQKFGATVFALEHRYYGDSIVGGTVEDPNPDLKYLSSLQMLHDVAHFIRTKNAEMVNTSPWITFGGSYGGSLSIWTRVLFPDLVAGAVGSSPPLEAKLDLYEFMQLVGKSLGTYKDQPRFCKHLVSKVP